LPKSRGAGGEPFFCFCAYFPGNKQKAALGARGAAVRI